MTTTTKDPLGYMAEAQELLRLWSVSKPGVVVIATRYGDYHDWAVHHSQLRVVIEGWGGKDYSFILLYDPRAGEPFLCVLRRDVSDACMMATKACVREIFGARWDLPFNVDW